MFLFVSMVAILIAQEKTTICSLQRIDIFANQINLSDTIDTWKNYYAGLEGYQNYVYESYLTAFQFKGRQFFVKDRYASVVPGFFDSHTTFLISNLDILKTIYNAVSGFTDLINPPPFPSNFRIYKTANGVWCLRNYSHSAFIDSNLNYSQAYFPNNSKIVGITHIPGKVGELYLVATTTSKFEIDYYLLDLTSSPKIDLNNRTYFVTDEYKAEWAPQKLQQIEDSVFVVKTKYNGLHLMKLKDNRFTSLKKLEDCSQYYFHKNYLYCFKEDVLNRLAYNIGLKEFNDKKTLLTGIGTYSVADENNGNYFFIVKDTLVIYNLFQETIINRISLGGISYQNFMLDSPNLFFTRIVSTTDIKANNQLPAIFSLSQNYPNPFNPETTIEYTIPSNVKGEMVNVTLKVYNVLGREVATLVDQYKQPGTYNSQFSILNYKLSSGVYFYTLRAGNHSITKKMILMR